jgi:DNA (cytosine-5)-methyltransferase 1
VVRALRVGTDVLGLTIGSLFSGIGGLELGLEQEGFGPVVWQVEIDPKRQAVLERHWPRAARFADVRAAHALASVDVVCGGFPCQDVSDASRGRGGGITGEKSGLWKDYARVVSQIKPRLVVVENVAGAAVKKWLPTVRRDLHVLGYRTRAFRIDARDVGAPHARARIFVVGDADQEGQPTSAEHAQVARMPETPRLGGYWGQPKPGVLRMAHGLPEGMDRLRMLGDAVVPECGRLVGRLMKMLYRLEERFT